MALGGTPYAYRSGKTVLHKLNAAVKLLCLLAFSLAAFLEKPALLAAFTALLVCAALSARIHPISLLRGSRPVALLGLFVALGRAVSLTPPVSDTGVSDTGVFDAGVFDAGVFDTGVFGTGLLFLWAMLLAFAAGSLLFAVTTTSEIREAAVSIENLLLKPLVLLLEPVKNRRVQRFKARLGQPRLGLALSLMLGFLPRFFRVWEETRCAYRARCGKKGPAETLALTMLSVTRMIDSACETALALEARGEGMKNEE
jgi:biotin transport system permease protein